MPAVPALPPSDQQGGQPAVSVGDPTVSDRRRLGLGLVAAAVGNALGHGAVVASLAHPTCHGWIVSGVADRDVSTRREGACPGAVLDVDGAGLLEHRPPVFAVWLDACVEDSLHRVFQRHATCGVVLTHRVDGDLAWPAKVQVKVREHKQC